MTYDGSKVKKIIKASSWKLKSLIKEKQIKVQLMIEHLEKIKQSLTKDRMKQNNKQSEKTNLDDNVLI